MNVGDKCYCLKTGKSVRIKAFVIVRIGQRDVAKVVTDRGERFYDELMAMKRVSDSWWGRILFGR